MRPKSPRCGYGHLRDFPVERICRDPRVCQIYEGTRDIQKILIGRALARDGGEDLTRRLAEVRDATAHHRLTARLGIPLVTKLAATRADVAAGV